jgi:CubicO group peptidase (beta-lactamase class C family)
MLGDLMANETALREIADPRFRGLCEQVVAAMRRLQVPGVAVGVVDGDAEHVAGFGVTNVDHPLPVDGDTLFQIGSITKTVTGTAAMRLVEQGRLDLDAPIRAYLPDLRLADAATAAGVTLRHLFSHTAGWVGDYFDDLGNGDDALAKIVDRMADLPQITPLGTIWSYNNAGFYLAGGVIEIVTGKTYEAAVQELVLGPLGMSMSCFFAADAITYRVAVGHESPYEAGAGPPKVLRPWALARTANPAGGISSTARDQLRYARFHMGDGAAADGTRLLTPESIALMQTPYVPAANDEFSGITWFLRDADGVRLVRHGGGTNGQLSVFLMAPARSFAISILTNANRGGELHREITSWALREYLGIDERPPEPLALAEEQLAAYAGRYTAAMDEIALSLGAGTLTMRITPKGGFPMKDSPAPPAPPPMRLALCGADRAVVLDEPLRDTFGEFLRAANGTIAWFRLGGRIHARSESYSGAQSN